MPSQTEIDFRSSCSGLSQTEKLRRYLLARPNTWLPMPELAAEIRAYAVHSRIADCRALGLTIHHKNVRQSDGSTASFYLYQPPDNNNPVRTLSPASPS